MDDTNLTTFENSANFKSIVEQHKANGWINLPEDQKAFICTYIRDGYSVSPMIARGCSEDEAQSYLSEPLVRAAIADVSEAYVAINTFSTVGWRTKLARALEMAMGEVPRPVAAKVAGKNVVTMVRSADLATAARLLELAAKYRDIKDEPKDKEFQRFAALPWEARA